MICGELSDESVEEFESPAENSRKSTHLISGDTDNAEGHVVIYVVFGNGTEEPKTRNPLLENL